MLMSEEKNMGTKPLQERSHSQFQTVILSRSRILQKLLAIKSDADAETEAAANPTRVTLIIRGISEQLSLGEGKIALLGRADFEMGGFQPDVDLTSYGAMERGVSRAHARLHISKGLLYVTDLYSANGTYLRTERLDPEKPYLVNSGDEIVLGSLGLKVEMD